jgi:hypothetical protein
VSEAGEGTGGSAVNVVSSLFQLPSLLRDMMEGQNVPRNDII